MDKDTHVYCTHCKYGGKLIKSIMDDNKDLCSDECNSCNPYNPEDSCKYEERPNYIKNKNIRQ